MDKNAIKYGAIGLGVLVAIVLLRGGGGGSSGAGGNMAATLQTFADTNATGVKYANISLQRDAIVQQMASDRATLISHMFDTATASSNTIATQTINTNALLVGHVLDTSAAIDQSRMASALAITLSATNADVTKFLATTDANTQIKLGQYQKDINKTNQEFGLAKSMDNNGAKFLTSMFGK